MESGVHNSLVDQGFLMPYVYYNCLDHKYLGGQFLIMDFLPGAMLHLVFDYDTPIVLGKTHAALHNADPGRLNKALIAESFGNRQYGIEGQFDQLLTANEHLPWLEEIVLWLIENRPSEYEHPYTFQSTNSEPKATVNCGSSTTSISHSSASPRLSISPLFLAGPPYAG
jgi:aminoglycoside phosphotransferase (APT) family kinase protein